MHRINCSPLHVHLNSETPIPTFLPSFLIPSVDAHTEPDNDDLGLFLRPLAFALVSTFRNNGTLIKKIIKFSSYIRKFRVEQLQSHIWLTASSYIGKYLPISSYIRKHFLIYDFATAPLWISLYMRKIWFSFLSVYISLSVQYRSWGGSPLYRIEETPYNKQVVK
jgi:hypothetical protein